MKSALILVSALSLVACSDPYRNLYEGIKASNDAKRTPNDRAVSPAPGYDTYRKEREQQK